MTGNIFNIQKFSIHDGPGIRTTVFFKGCPLRCQWCANPESQSFDTQISYDPRKCTGCQSCVHSCPHGLIRFNGGSFSLDRSRCRGCLSCVRHCIAKALKAEGEAMDLKEVVDVCLADLPFYEESGGGVTLSGGECFCQPEFVKALLGELKKNNIHVAAETAGYVDEDIFMELAPLFDLLLYDVKHHDSNRHRDKTGVPNERIIKNLTLAHTAGIRILPRIPVIPGFNDSLSDAAGLAKLIAGIGITQVQLLPFHQLGERKYELLNRTYDLKDVKALHPEDLESYRQVFAKQGLDCYI